jgi:hypothetical protein
MDDDPKKIAQYLIERFGLEQASTQAVQSSFEAQEKGHLYELSVWRDVKRILAKQRDDQTSSS